MRRTAVLIATMLASASQAWADRPLFNWSGFYLGAHAGYGWGTTDQFDNSLSFTSHGLLAGGQVGINRQIGNFVFGIEADAAWADLRGDVRVNSFFNVGNVAFTSDADWLATVTGRVGVAQGASLLYVKGGVAWAGTNHGTRFAYAGPPPAPFDFMHRDGAGAHPGWTLGGGIEHAFAPNWSARVEYAFVSLPTRSFAISGPNSIGGVVTNITEGLDVMHALHLVRFGVNYHFGGPATTPVVAPMPPSGFDWTGFYLGVHAGYGGGTAVWTDLDPRRHLDLDGGLAGGQFGLNLQVGRIVFGAEIEAAWTGVTGGLTGVVSEPGVGTARLDIASRLEWLGTAAGRFGVAHDRWLLFVKAGAAAAQTRHAYDLAAPGLLQFRTSGRHHHAGVLIGGGIEHALAPNWSVKAEYNFIDFGSENVTTLGTAGGTLLTGNVLGSPSVRQQLHLAKLGVNYRFAPP
jgi:opacity protein-like surface antigen